MIDDDFVRAGDEPQTLKHAIVVVDDAGGETVDEDLRFARRHLKAQRHGAVAGRDAEWRIRIGVPLAETQGMVMAAGLSVGVVENTSISAA